MKTWIMIPTYNEKENISKIIKEILNIKKDLNIVVVDDNSPDKTWQIVEEISKKDKRVHLLLRKTERGRGLAGKAGYRYCLDNGADLIIEMDADFSHDPRYIPQLISATKDSDLILGSRAVQGGKETGRSLFRRILTKAVNLYVRLLLGLRIKDCNSGFRCFQRKVLEKIDVNSLKSTGPSIVQEVLFKVHLNGFKIKEIPITFRDRELGTSKLGLAQISNGYLMLTKLKILHMLGRI